MSIQLPIFDSLTHPTLTGRWLNSEHEATFDALIGQMAANQIKWTCAVGLDGIENYEHREFMARCREQPELIPVAGFNPETCRSIGDEIANLKEMGFRAVKLHPRLSNLSLSRPEAIIATLTAAHSAGMPVFLCTYQYAPAEKFSGEDQLLSLARIIAAVPDARVVLMHGGTVEVLRYSEFARSNPNVVIDLSYTLQRYEGSSVDLDIAYLFRVFDRRLCIGSDFPEFSLATLRRRFEHFARQTTPEKAENIAYRNLLRVFELDRSS